MRPERFPNWRVVPLYVNLGGTSYRDYVDLGPDELYARLADAASSRRRPRSRRPGDFLAVYEELAPRYERISRCRSPRRSRGPSRARTPPRPSAGDAVRVIDTRTVSAAVAMLALAIQRRLERGTTDEEIDALVERFRATHGLLFTVDTLEFLARGGRIGRGAAFAGTLLNVKPILGIVDGEVVPLKRVRGSQKALEEFASLLVGGDRATRRRSASGIVARGGARAARRARAARARGAAAGARSRSSRSLGAVVGTHAGPGHARAVLVRRRRIAAQSGPRSYTRRRW